MAIRVILDVEVHDKSAQAKYLVHGYDDLYWVDTIDQVAATIKQELEKLPPESPNN